MSRRRNNGEEGQSSSRKKKRTIKLKFSPLIFKGEEDSDEDCEIVFERIQADANGERVLRNPPQAWNTESESSSDDVSENVESVDEVGDNGSEDSYDRDEIDEEVSENEGNVDKTDDDIEMGEEAAIDSEEYSECTDDARTVTAPYQDDICEPGDDPHSNDAGTESNPILVPDGSDSENAEELRESMVMRDAEGADEAVISCGGSDREEDLVLETSSGSSMVANAETLPESLNEGLLDE